METEKVKCLIIGSGPAGYTAAIYAARANLSPVLYEGLQPGGQLTTTTDIENFPGYPEGISGTQMMEDLRKQAERFGADLRFGVATAADLSKSPYKITIDEEKVIEAQTIIIATGAAAKYLGLEDEKKYAGMGVSACATCDGFFYRKKVVAVVGGGDTACEEASYLAGLASKVYLIVRKPFLRASKIMQERVMNNEKIEVLFEHNAVGLYGDNRFEHFITERVIDNFSYALVECLALVKLSNNNATNTQVRVQAFLDNLNYACNLRHSAHGEELCLHRNNQKVRCGKGIECQQAQ